MKDYIGRYKVKKLQKGAKVGKELQDFGSRMLHGLQTFGGSYVGDFIQGISPQAANVISKYTAGIIAPTPEEYLKSNRNSWKNRTSNTMNALSYIGAGEVSGPLLGKGIKAIEKIIPRHFKFNPEAYYRAIGDEVGLHDVRNSGLVRPNQSGIFKDRNAYYTKGIVNDAKNPVVGGGVQKGTHYKGKYIVEVTPGEHFPKPANTLNPEWNFGLTTNNNHIPLDASNVTILKKNWLQGYKEISKKENGGNLSKYEDGGKVTNFTTKKQSGGQIGQEFQDLGSRMIHGLQTFGGSYIGDAVQGVSPKAADVVSKYTAGMIAPTPQNYLDRNRSSWKNRASSAMDATSMLLAGEVAGPVIGKVGKYVGKAAKPAIKAAGKTTGKVIEKLTPKKPIQNIFNSAEEGSQWWDEIASPNFTEIELNNMLINRYGKEHTIANLDKRLAAGESKANIYNKLYEATRHGSDNFRGWVTRTEKASMPVNRSRFIKKEVSEKVKPEHREILNKMSDDEFMNTVFKPNNEIAAYIPDDKIPTVSKEIVPMSAQEYAKEFNQNIHVLDDIIAKNNKSGTAYWAKGIDETGALEFGSEHGTSPFFTNITPGRWRGEVMDIANENYYRTIPGLEMSNTTNSVFADNIPRKGSGAYKSINEYLKQFDLGRVKPGFNSQTFHSRTAWENMVEKGEGVGYYQNPKLIYGIMKTGVPLGIGAGISGKKEKGGKIDWINTYKRKNKFI